MSAEESLSLFKNIPEIAEKLKLMQELGLEYLTLGQKFNTLSGGELQRLKLVSHLARKDPHHTLYILDEPSAGLHFHDIKKLMMILYRLIKAGNSILMVEHNLEMIQKADHLLELGPGGGPAGGNLIFQGPPEKIPPSTATGRALALQPNP